MLQQVFEKTTIEYDFANLGEHFSTAIQPLPLTDPEWVHFNERLADRLGLAHDNAAARQALLELFAGQTMLPAGRTVAAAYSGHQFGVWAGQLGDGRAHLLGRINGPQAQLELQLKGSGRTPYSRMGDGRAVLRSSIREYLASHAMKALGVPTTEALGLIRSQDRVYRERVETAAIVVRTAETFVRFGSFEHWHGRPEQMAQLLRYCIQRFFPDLAQAHDEVLRNAEPLPAELILQWFDEVVARTARLVAHWQVLGFCHGVMNTDNMSILGLTIDYGPYAFMDEFHHAFTPNTTDQGRRYAWYQQPPIAFWNLSRLGSALTTLGVSAEDLQQVLEHFEDVFWPHYHLLMRNKLGLTKEHPGDPELFDQWWKLLNQGRADFSLSFRYLADYQFSVPETAAERRFVELFAPEAESQLQSWLTDYHTRLSLEPLSHEERRTLMHAHNPLYVLRNHLAQHCIAAAEVGDYGPLAEAFEVLSDPCREQPGRAFWARPPKAEERVPMLSCSS